MIAGKIKDTTKTEEMDATIIMDPSSHSIFIHFEKAVMGSLSIHLENMHGDIVCELFAPFTMKDKLNLNVGEVPHGMYLLAMEYGEQKMKQTVFIE